MKRIAGLFFIIFMVSGCKSNRIYERYETVNGYQWQYHDIKTFTAKITDTSAIYNLYVDIRNSEAYPYSNLWLNLTSKSPEGIEQKQRFNFTLADVDGKWNGDILGDVHDHRFTAASQVRFPRTGTYTFNLQQDMRIDPLPGVMDVGIRLEKN